MDSVGPKYTISVDNFAAVQSHGSFFRIRGNDRRPKAEFCGRAFAFSRRQSLEFLV
jgi:hypothetical protein